MKVALCMSGIPRGEYEGFNFVKKMSEKYDCYLFLHSWNPKSFPYNESWSKKMPSDFSKEHIPLPLEKIFHKEEEFLNCESQLIEKYNCIPSQYLWRKDIGPCSMFYGIKQASLLKEEYENKAGEKFDCSFRIRFETYIKFITIENFDLKLLHLPAFGSYPICDQFAFSNSQNMSYYSNCYENIVELSKNDLYHPERILNQHLKDQPVNLVHFGNDMSL